MSNFPIFLSLENKKILVIGAGNIALRRINNLLEFTKNITILSEDFSQDIDLLIKKYNLTKINRKYEKKDILDFDMVICAVNNLELQENIYFESRSTHILYNCVDFQKYCDFYFPTFLKEGDLTLAISTNGVSPAFSKNLKVYLKKILPNDIDKFLSRMKELRKTLPKGEKRMSELKGKVSEYFEKSFKL
ncbi:bifunctional precorrin-2 dehydrogenase/sirohydrochlorin ferrochelatase [Halarcobacter sp.]|uniref:precorrin-2 dehydrogenase/sirohydrochlorin ferrochelatase family protein n=1 Tax=Halarcobacter sp. TaxID=2321133 RepID=UPI0029F5A8D1|nr:bifunctional precorrin-2 dehydrogenase/sirohydrochlorin ferrochelatase [Halarcobacter sp.]